jgi:glycosyltransferase involved in cell wall biosynthesis
VVASNVHGIPDAVLDGKTGLLVPPKDAQALASALARLIEDPAERADLGRTGREFVSANYDWQANTAQMLRLYERLTIVPPA